MTSTVGSIAGIMTSIAALAASICLLSSFSSDEGRELRPLSGSFPTKELNKTLDNDMSESAELAPMDRDITNFMRQWQFQGAQVSVSRNDSLLFSKGYGEAGDGIAMTPGHILRLASVSKLITATGIMVLCDRDSLKLSDTVFGPEGILSDSLYTSAIKDRNYFKITVEDLLRHKGGFTTRRGDPMFTTKDIIVQNRLKSPPDSRTLMKIILGRPLDFLPGTSQSYSNFGYLILSLIIEKVSGQPYEDFIQENVLRPAGCYDFHIAGNLRSERRPNETCYFVPSNEHLIPKYDNSGEYVVRCYGGNDIHALSGAGAWTASSAELSRFVASIDGDPRLQDVISEDSLGDMIEYFDPDTFSLGWNDTDPEKGWDRTGTFSGTSALVHRYPDGECWIFISNTSSWRGPAQARYTRELFRELREKYSAKLPKQDLFR